MNLPFSVEEIKRRLIPTREESAMVVLTFDLTHDVWEDFVGVSEFIVNEIGFSAEDLPSNTFVKIVMANRASSEKLVEYYRRRLRNYLDQNELSGGVFIVCGERWASNVPIGV
jgi:hypothetical protein